MLEFDRSRITAVRQAERAEAAASRRAAEAAALAALHAARDAFVGHADEIYGDGAEAALLDCDRLEHIADRLAEAIERLKPALEELDVARDVALYRGPTLNRARSLFDPARLALLAGETLAEALLSGPAGAVLTAALRRRAL